MKASSLSHHLASAARSDREIPSFCLKTMGTKVAQEPSAACSRFVGKPDLGITSGLPVIRTSGTDTVHFSSKVSDLFASQRICLSLWLCGGFHFFRLF